MKKLYRIIFPLIIIITIFVWTEIAKSPEGDALSVYFLNVGQGDAVLIQKNDQEILIDGGPSGEIANILGGILKSTDRKIETVILTHPHSDHLAGINKIIDHYEIGQIYFTGAIHTSNQYLEFLEKVKNKNIKLTVPAINEQKNFLPNSSITFLWPGDQFSQKTVENLNDTSLISQFCYFKQCLFAPGDAEVRGQNEMFSYYEKNFPDFNFHSILLKVSHHGSSNAANPKLYEKVLPKYSIISVGEGNTYGHPHPSSLELAKNFNSQILRTDTEGTVRFILTQEGVVQNP
ncbi:MAG: MBL fold metallo-hydrolase [Patescibacteria group bacterium]